MDELKKLLDEIKSAHEEFKRTNDERLKQIEKKGHADGLLDEKLEKINTEISRLQDEMKAAQTDANRVTLYGADGRPMNEVRLSREEKEYRDSSVSYIRKGRVDSVLETRGMEAGSDENGGYLLSKPAMGRIVSKVYETTPFRQYATVETISTDKLEGMVDNDEASSGWVGENEPRESVTGTPALGMYSIEVGEIWAQPQVTQRLLDDQAVDVERWLADKVAKRFARQENNAFINGNGVKKPRGICSYTTAATADSARAWGTVEHIASGASGDFVADASKPADTLIDMAYALKADYRAGAAWMMPRLVESKIRKFKDSQNQYLWQPSLQAGRPATLLGYDIIPAEDMPALAANSLSLGFGNWAEAYTIVDRIGIRVIRDAITKKGWVKFYSTKRVGGAVVNFEAYKLMKFA